ncbi:MAG: hypothetical protein WAU42_01880 [Solirubrobacteraceae bacterium]
MEEIFAALAHSTRLWLVLYLMEHGPTRQVELGRALERAGILERSVGSGEMSQLVRPLLAAGLVVRDRPRGPLYLTKSQQIQRLITTASAISVAATSDSNDEAKQRHAQLMRGVAGAVVGRRAN